MTFKAKFWKLSTFGVQHLSSAGPWDDISTPIVPEPLQLKESHLPKLDIADRVERGV